MLYDDYYDFSGADIAKVRIVQLDDDQIVRGARERQVTNAGDVSLRGQHITPIRGGLYDPTIFGSPEQCYCGRVKTIHEYCPSCHTYVYTSNEYAEGYAYYNMNVPYVHLLRIGHLVDWLNQVGIPIGFSSKRMSGGEDGLLQHIWSIVVDIDESIDQDSDEYDLVDKRDGKHAKLTITDLRQTDHYNFGLIGLYSLKDYKLKNGNDLAHITHFINYKFIITSPADRMYSSFKSEGQLKLTLPAQTLNYKPIIEFNNSINGLMDQKYTNDVDRATLCYVMNSLIFKVQREAELIRSSKESLIRNLVPTRVTESGRSTIIGDPNLNMNEIGVPKSMMYQMLDAKIIDKLRDDGNNYARRLYMNADPLALEAMADLASQSICLFCRNPSLHKYNILAFYPRLHDGIEIRVPISVLEGFNADFDGDQMWLQVITDPMKVASFETMLPSNNWRYEKSDKIPYQPSEEVLFGLYEASRRVRPKKMKVYFDFDTLKEAVRTDQVKCNEEVKYNDRITTYGLELLTQCLGTRLSTVLGCNEGEEIITDGNINDICGWIGAHDNRVEMLQKLQDIGVEISTKTGIDTTPFVDLLGGTKDEVKAIASSNKATSKRINEIKDTLKHKLRENLEKLPDSNFDLLRKSGAKFKESAIVELYGPTTILHKDGSIDIDNTNLFKGLSQRAYTELANTNRYALELKQYLVPLGGYNQRQLSILAMKYKYSDTDGSNDTVGALLDYKDAIGRTKLDGTEITRAEASNKGTVRVKSFINSNSNTVYRDEIASVKYSAIDGSSIGISFASALSEALTQAALGLKHGASKLNYEDASIKAVEPGIISEINPMYIEVKGSHTYRYPITRSASVNPELKLNDKVVEGDELVYSTKRIGLDWNLARVNTLIDINTVDGAELGKKLPKSISVSPYNGTISYDIPNRTVRIGSMSFDMDLNELYFYPEGYQVHVNDIISTGVLKMEEFATRVSDNGIAFYAFARAFKSYVSSVKNSEPIEILFRAIMGKKFSVLTTNNTNSNYLERIYQANGKNSFEEAIRTSKTGDISIDESVLIPILFRLPKSSV